jgi:hypothetical protein
MFGTIETASGQFESLTQLAFQMKSHFFLSLLVQLFKGMTKKSLVPKIDVID